VVAKPFDTPQILEIVREVARRREVNIEGVASIVAA
jgi:hypothetical protein